MIDNEINLRKLWLSVKSREGKTITETAIWVDSNIEQLLLDRGEITNVKSVEFYRNEEEASKRWKYI